MLAACWPFFISPAEMKKSKVIIGMSTPVTIVAAQFTAIEWVEYHPAVSHKQISKLAMLLYEAGDSWRS